MAHTIMAHMIRAHTVLEHTVMLPTARPSLALLFLAIVLATLAACGGAPTKVVTSGDADSPTGGIGLAYIERDIKESRHRRYELDPDGTLRIGSGRAALLDQTDWKGVATPEQIAAIVGAARASGIFDGPPTCEPQLVDGDEMIFTTVEFAMPKGDPRGKRSYQLEGRCPSILPLRAAFEQASRARFVNQLDALPQAGAQAPRPK